MFFTLSKIIGWLIYPLSITFILLLIALLGLLRKKRKTSRIFLISAISILYLFSIKPIASFLLYPLENMHINPSDQYPKADAIVVLSPGIRYSKYPSMEVELDFGSNRILKAVRLFKDGAAPLILMSGGSGELFSQRKADAHAMKSLAIEFGVPENRILVETQSRNTYENALYSKEILKDMGVKTIILVTSAFHMPRAVAVFKKIGIEPIPAVTDFQSPRKEFDIFCIVPDASNLNRSSLAIKEYAGLLIYRLKGWL
ncbi:MAG: YdcF family protein [Nitrospirota bacterium]